MAELHPSQHTTPENDMTAAYEVLNPSFGDMNIEQQIEHGINDWCAEGRDGHPYYGQTKADAEAIRATYEA